jgi:hypothetical protein
VLVRAGSIGRLVALQAPQSIFSGRLAPPAYLNAFGHERLTARFLLGHLFLHQKTPYECRHPLKSALMAVLIGLGQ